MDNAIAAVIGGTGFLGRRVVVALAERGWRVRCVARHPDEGQDQRAEPIAADVRHPESLRDAVADARLVVNAVSLYTQTAETSFHDVHVDGAVNVARAAQAAAVSRLIHLSGIGADANARDAYLSARGAGEDAVYRTWPGAIILRPSVMVGPDDAFVRPLADLVRRLPLIPLFGRGRTRLQPVAGDDVAGAIATLADAEEVPDAPVELGGPDTLTYRQILALIARQMGKRRALMPLPFWAWQAIGVIGERLPGQPVTRHNVALMRRDNVAAREPPWDMLGIAPTPLLATVEAVVGKAR